MEPVESAHYAFGLFLCHHAADGQRQFFAAQLFGDGQRETRQRSIALLAMGRDRVVDERLHPFGGEVLLQLVAAGRQDGEEMVDVLPVVEPLG